MIRTAVPDNPFEINTSSGLPVLFHHSAAALLAGIHVDTEAVTDPNNQDIDNLMLFLKNNRNNFYRHWVTAYWLYDTPAKKQRLSPFLFTNGKWDLRLYNETYFERLRYVLGSARRHGVIVQLTMFDCPGLKVDYFGGDTSKRWSQNPWNSSTNVNGVIVAPADVLPEFYDRTNATLAGLQDAYARQVVLQTRDFSNVVYEIINEPTSAPSSTLAGWANAILNVIGPMLQGRRLVFYNDYSGNYNDNSTRGKDVNLWHDQMNSLSSYASLDGVIFHGDPTQVNPSQYGAYNWTWGKDKIIQLSTDAFPATLPNTTLEEREDYNWNKNATTTILNRNEIYQAEATSDGAAGGIRDASTKPSVLSLLPVVGCWERVSPVSPYFNIRFDSKNHYVLIDPNSDQIIEKGDITAFDNTTVTLKADPPSNATNKLTYTLSDDGRRLSYFGSAGVLQTFERVPFELEPLLFGWEKIYENYTTASPHFFLHFHKNKAEGGNVIMKARDPNNQQTIIDYGEVRSIASPVIVINSHVLGGDINYTYELYTDPVDHLEKLKLVNNTAPPPSGHTEPRTQIFKRKLGM